jgi:hypothetical protein
VFAHVAALVRVNRTEVFVRFDSAMVWQGIARTTGFPRSVPCTVTTNGVPGVMVDGCGAEATDVTSPRCTARNVN